MLMFLSQLGKQKKMLGKKAQVSDTMTWIVATLAIIVFLYLGIAIAGGQGWVKSILGFDREVDYVSLTERVVEESVNSYLLTPDQNNALMYNLIKFNLDDNLDANTGPLAETIFKGLYKDKYLEFWFGVTSADPWRVGNGVTWNGKKNDYFGSKPKTSATGAMGNYIIFPGQMSHTRLLHDNKYVELYLREKP